MDFNQIETTKIEETVNAVVPAIRELADLELALIGGGHGDVAI
jgi:hypothetical protein